MSSRHTHIAEDRAVHVVDDGEFEQELTETADPNEVLAFICQLVEWYESDVDHRDELPLFATVVNDGCVYIRDAQGGEWLTWTVDEWTLPPEEGQASDGDYSLEDTDRRLNTDVIRPIINAIATTYESPSEIKQRHDCTQIESCSP
ncbi:hypothetical protein [Halorubrum sp. AJ67]|uniref:hypothetical protein n=1 Tax=Halorubrum sp. AJ67 TaxID=1173487 RepID=UPI0003DBEB11|nr:hypothetical protein [Halorubrum sp. AJ67]CDK38065.1 hypothetical protein BN903_265 [Halorubrum sp. AJ67]